MHTGRSEYCVRENIIIIIILRDDVENRFSITGKKHSDPDLINYNKFINL